MRQNKLILLAIILLCKVMAVAQPSLADTTKLFVHDALYSWRVPLSTLKTYMGGGTVTSVTVTSANGLAGTVANSTSAANITLSTTITGVLKGNGTSISAATSGTDYSAGTSGLATGILKSTTSTGALTIAVAADFPTLNQNTTGSAATLTTARAIYGNNFDGSAALTQIIASTYGGTGNGFTKFSGPSTSEKTFTLPNASAIILTDNAAVTIAQGGTALTSLGTAKQILRVNSGATALEYSSIVSAGSGVAAGTTSDPAASAILDCVSTTKGVLLTPMTTAQRDAISSPAANLFVTNTETDGLDQYNGTRWFRFNQSSGTPTFTRGSGWGTGATSSIEGTDLAGKITVTSGTGSITATTFGTVTFNKAFPTGAKYAVVLQAENSNAIGANFGGYMRPSNEAASLFDIDTSNSNITTRLSTSTAYVIYYHVVQYE